MKINGIEVTAVASDLDGTLLGESQTGFTEGVFEVIRALTARGVHFVAASGRQYENMVKMLAPVKDDIYFVCENGSVIVYRDEIIHMDCMDEALTRQLISDIYAELGDMDVLISTEGSVFARSSHADFVIKNNALRGQCFRMVDDFAELKQPKNKISIQFPDGVVRGETLREKYADILESVDAGGGWLDFTAKNVSKGNALTFLRENVFGSNTRFASFGDSENDVSMFPVSAVSFAMSGSSDDVKARASFVCANVEETLKAALEA